MKRHHRYAALATAVAVAALTGCATTAAPASDGDEAAASGKTSYTVAIEINYHPLIAYLAAKSDELFADTPYDVTVDVLDSSTIVPTFGSGQIDVASIYPPTLVRMEEQYDFDPVYFFPLARYTPGNQLLVPGNSSATSVEDLKGQKVATGTASMGLPVDDTVFVEQFGESINDYFEIVETDTAAQEAGLGRVQAVLLSSPYSDALLAEGWEPVWTFQDEAADVLGDPAINSGGFVVSSEFAQENTDFMQTLVDVLVDVWLQYQEDPDSVLTVAAQESGLPIEQLQGVAQILALDDMPVEQMQVTDADIAAWQAIFDYMYETGWAGTELTSADIFVPVVPGA